MQNFMKLTIKDFGPVDNADLDIGKITVVGGHNSTGKSTASKLLFSFLKANSSKRKDLAIDSVDNQIKQLIVKFIEYSRLDSKNSVLIKEIIGLFEQLYETDDLKSKVQVYDELKEIYIKMNLKNGYKHDFDEIFMQIDDLIKTVDEDASSLYASIIRKLLKSEFSNYNGIAELSGIIKGFNYDFIIDFENYDLDDAESFRYDGGFAINDVFYMDSMSVLDLSQHHGLQNTDHFKFLQEYIKPESDNSNQVFDEKLFSKQIKLVKNIKKIINGEFRYENDNLVFITEEGIQTLMKDTASGVKQIGIIQLLLSHRILKENSFLIIDEPEVNLHQEWQFKLAEILVLMVKDLNISVYINSHSPMFIEAMEVLTKYYDLKDETNYYLAKFDDNLFTFNHVNADELYELYDNLSKPYIDMRSYRL